MAVGPIMNPKYLPSVAHVYCGVSSVVVSGVWSPSVMAICFCEVDVHGGDAAVRGHQLVQLLGVFGP